MDFDFSSNPPIPLLPAKVTPKQTTNKDCKPPKFSTEIKRLINLFFHKSLPLYLSPLLSLAQVYLHPTLRPATKSIYIQAT